MRHAHYINYFLQLNCLLLLALSTQAQQIAENTISFSGFIMNKDSLPVENAHLINCRNLTIVPTNESGYFRCKVLDGDSLAIIHISYQRIFVKPNPDPATKNCYYLTEQSYEISPVIIQTFEKDLARFKKNMTQISFQMKNFGKPNDYRRNIAPKSQNTYAPGFGHAQYGRGIGKQPRNKIR